MLTFLLLVSVIIIACVIFNKISHKLGIPMLLAFIVLGMIFGSDGLFKIDFSNFAFAEQICSVALIFIMFYGGFGTKWREAKPIAVKAVVLSSAGTVLTAVLVGLFCRLVLKIQILESFLIGSVISSTDAASVFSILRSKKLNLKYNTASLLEVESGSNDPFSYMLTIVCLALLKGDVSAGGFIYMLFAQIAFGAAFGVAAAFIARLFLKYFKFASPGFDAIFIAAVAVASYAVPSLVGGNGYLSAYITGIILGNTRIANKVSLVSFFDGVTGFMQMLLFFLLGLLSFPSQLPAVVLPALAIAVFLTFVARPIAVFAILTPFKSKLRQQLLVSWAGMRGAASIVFAIMAIIDPAVMDNDIFHMVFFIVLFSILLQGTLLPVLSKKLNMTDEQSDVMKTFNDYVDEVHVGLIQFTLSGKHDWIGKRICEIILPPDSLLVLLIRDGKKLVPNGKTVFRDGDTLILSGKAADKADNVDLYEKTIRQGDEFENKTVAEIPSGENLIILIRRGKGVIIPRGKTLVKDGDVLVINEACE